MCFYLQISTVMRGITLTDCQECWLTGLEAIFIERWWFTFSWEFSDLHLEL